MAISAREANIRRDQELNKIVWFTFEHGDAPRRCCICGEGFWDGIDLDGDLICNECKEVELRRAARYLNPAFAERLEELIENESIKF